MGVQRSFCGKMKTKEETAFQEAQPEAFDEPDDELEEFDEIGGEIPVDAELQQWEEDWDAAGWDDEDPDDSFVKRLKQELETFKANQVQKQEQRKSATSASQD